MEDNASPNINARFARPSTGGVAAGRHLNRLAYQSQPSGKFRLANNPELFAAKQDQVCLSFYILRLM